MRPQRIPVSIGNDIPPRAPSPFTKQLALYKTTESSTHASPSVTPCTSTSEPPTHIQSPPPAPPPRATNSGHSEPIVTPTVSFPPLEQQDDSQQRYKKAPLALRRLASYNAEGRKGLGEYIPEHNSDS